MQAPPSDSNDRTGADAPVSDQQAFWNSWNSIFIDAQRGPTSLRQAEVVEAWLLELGRRDSAIIDVGCGTGWMCQRLLSFGSILGIDLSDDVLDIARQRIPQARFVAGDFMQLDLPEAEADIVVTLEVLAHVADQRAFLKRISNLLRPGGHLLLATQNRFVLERSAGVAPRAHGQIRQWVDRRQLQALLSERFDVKRLVSIYPYGHGGILRVVNSPKLNSLVSRVVTQQTLNRLKEKIWLGHTLMALAQVRR